MTMMTRKSVERARLPMQTHLRRKRCTSSGLSAGGRVSVFVITKSYTLEPSRSGISLSLENPFFLLDIVRHLLNVWTIRNKAVSYTTLL